LIDLAAAPVPPVTVAVVISSMSPDGQVPGEIGVVVAEPRVVVPVPFHVIVEVVAVSELLVFPLPPVFFVSLHPEIVTFAASVVVFTLPDRVVHDTPPAAKA